MDRSTIDRDNIIERFVLGQLTDAELDTFLTYQLFHPEIKTEVEAVRVLVKSTRGPSSRQPVKWWQKTGFHLVLLLVALSIGVATWRFSRRPAEPAALPTPAAPPQQAIEPVAPILPSDTLETTPAPPANRQIAADFRPNPRLESMLGPGQFRGNAEEQPVWVKTPPKEQTCENANTSCRLNLNAQLRGDAERIKGFRWLLFTNKAADYTAFRPLRSGAFSLKTNPDQTVDIAAEPGLRLSPGLYYYLIEDEESGAVYFTGKLTLR